MTEHSAATTSVERSFRVLRFLAEGGSTANLSEAARRLEVNRVSLMRLLETLEHCGMLVALPQGGHRLGLAFLSLAAVAADGFDLTARAQWVLPGLAQKTGMTAYLVVRDEADIVYLQREMPDTPLISRIRIGSRLPAYCATPGLVMLAALPEEMVMALQSRHWQGDDAPAQDALLARLEQIRVAGCAWSWSGLEPGIDSCAAVIRSRRGEVLGALSVAGPHHVLADDPKRIVGIQTDVMLAAEQLAASSF